MVALCSSTNQIKGIESFMPTLPDGRNRVTTPGIKKAMANETDESHNCLNLRQNRHPQLLTESTTFTKQSPLKL